MSVDYYKNLCHQHVGRAVEIHTHDGMIHHGIIDHVDQTHVHIRSFNQAGGGQGGFAGPGGPGMYAFGFGAAAAGGALGAFTGVALANIAFFRPYPYY